MILSRWSLLKAGGAHLNAAGTEPRPSRQRLSYLLRSATATTGTSVASLPLRTVSSAEAVSNLLNNIINPLRGDALKAVSSLQHPMNLARLI